MAQTKIRLVPAPQRFAAAGMPTQVRLRHMPVHALSAL
jgi:hypothetical protein